MALPGGRHLGFSRTTLLTQFFAKLWDTDTGRRLWNDAHSDRVGSKGVRCGHGPRVIRSWACVHWVVTADCTVGLHPFVLRRQCCHAQLVTE